MCLIWFACPEQEVYRHIKKLFYFPTGDISDSATVLTTAVGLRVTNPADLLVSVSKSAKEEVRMQAATPINQLLQHDLSHITTHTVHEMEALIHKCTKSTSGRAGTTASVSCPAIWRKYHYFRLSSRYEIAVDGSF